jgi:hypothetical protein
VNDYLTIEPKSVSYLKGHMQTVSLACFVGFLAVAFISHFIGNEPTIASPLTIIAYTLFTASVYGFMALPTIEIYDTKKHPVYANFVLFIYVAAILITALAYANVLQQHFPVDGPERLLVPQVACGALGICFYLISSTINSS